MERVLIIGCGGSGKSTLARQLGEKTGLPVIHLDKVWWKPGWEHITKEAFDRELAALLDMPRWILDGNFNRTISMRLERCDTVIYLDFNRFVCLWGWLKRLITNWGRSRPDMPENCAERFDPVFMKWIWDFNRNNRKRYHGMLGELTGKQVVILKNRRQVKRYLNQI